MVESQNGILGEVEELKSQLASDPQGSQRPLYNRHFNSKTLTGSLTGYERTLYRLYYDIIRNLTINLIDYSEDWHSAPMLDVELSEWENRVYGYSLIGGTSADNLHVLGVAKKNALLGFGQLNVPVMETKEIEDSITGTTLQQITRYNPISSGYVVITNKYNQPYQTALGQNKTLHDKLITAQYAEMLSNNKTTQYINARLLRAAFIGLSKDKDLTALNVFNKIQNGDVFIGLDSGKINKFEDILQIIKLDVKDNLSSLGNAFSSDWAELLGFLGVDSSGIVKASGVSNSEAESNNQFIAAMRNVYLRGRQPGLDLLNKTFGTKLKARFALTDIDMMDDVDVYNQEVEGEENKGVAEGTEVKTGSDRKQAKVKEEDNG